MNPDEDAAKAVEEKRDLLERIADADLAISDDIEHILELVETEGDDVE